MKDVATEQSEACRNLAVAVKLNVDKDGVANTCEGPVTEAGFKTGCCHIFCFI